VRVGRIVAWIYVVAVLDKPFYVAVGGFRYNLRVAVGLVGAYYLVGFEDKASHVLVGVVFNLVDDFVGSVLLKWVENDPLGDALGLQSLVVAGLVKVGDVSREAHVRVLGQIGFVLECKHVLRRRCRGRLSC
jgi:hypothetical protein